MHMAEPISTYQADTKMATIKFEYSQPSQTLLQGSPGSAGWDIVAAESTIIPPGERYMVSTGVKMTECPIDCYLRMAPRSGLALKKGIDVFAGVIDSDYRGEIRAILFNSGNEPFHIVAGETRVAQLIPTQLFKCEANVSMLWRERGEQGFGSSG